MHGAEAIFRPSRRGKLLCIYTNSKGLDLRKACMRTLPRAFTVFMRHNLNGYLFL